MLTCQQVAEGVTDFLEGSLSWKDFIRFRIHFWRCIGCRNFLGQMKYTIRILQQLPPPPISPEKKQALLLLFRAWVKTHS